MESAFPTQLAGSRQECDNRFDTIHTRFPEVPLKRLLLLPLALALVQCDRVGTLSTGKYAVADQEYSSQNYVMERIFQGGGGFTEAHHINRCLLMEMSGTWTQEGGELTLQYARMRNRESCRDSLAAWSADSAKLEIPVRNVDGRSFESFLAASEGKPDKWIKWLKAD